MPFLCPQCGEEHKTLEELEGRVNEALPEAEALSQEAMETKPDKRKRTLKMDYASTNEGKLE